MNRVISHETYDEERALYGARDVVIEDTVFAGPADGESALKEARDISIKGCSFSLRYPLWHVTGFDMEHTTMDELTRAAIWYTHEGRIRDSKMHGIKAVRECSDIRIEDSDIVSPEFGWKSSDITVINSGIVSEYAFLDSRDLDVSGLRFSGKYSFQYTENVTVRDSVLDTKDAFWHSKNVTVSDCTLKGEYLAWYAEGLTLINCHITGTQPFCYCHGLKLINCTMEGCDLAFEYSDVDAEIQGELVSIKNPRSGRIICDGVGEIIRENAVVDCNGEVVIRGNI